MKFKRESAFFDDTKRQKRKHSRKMRTLLKSIGGRRGILLTSVLLDKPKYMEFEGN